MIDAVSSLFSLGRAEPRLIREPTGLAAGKGADFGTALSQAATDAVQTLKNAESTSMAGMEGKVSAQKVVEAVLAAEQTLQTAVAIRDKLVNSYLELTRMAI
jgi:flagellar hook-basal body complex protein FliE